MTDTTLKSVFTLDTETRSFKPVAHNLSAGEAVERLNSDQNAKIVDQGERHWASNLSKCKVCKKAAEELTEKNAADSSDSAQVGEEAVHAQEGEGD
jgi:hypothetical protein